MIWIVANSLHWWLLQNYTPDKTWSKYFCALKKILFANFHERWTTLTMAHSSKDHNISTANFGVEQKPLRLDILCKIKDYFHITVQSYNFAAPKVLITPPASNKKCKFWQDSTKNVVKHIIFGKSQQHWRQRLSMVEQKIIKAVLEEKREYYDIVQYSFVKDDFTSSS